MLNAFLMDRFCQCFVQGGLLKHAPGGMCSGNIESYQLTFHQWHIFVGKYPPPFRERVIFRRNERIFFQKILSFRILMLFNY